MKKLTLMAIMAVCLIALSFTQNTFAQQTNGSGQTYLNVTVYNNAHTQGQPNAEVWVENEDGGVVIDPQITGSNGQVSFSLLNFSSGTYIIKACYPVRPDNQCGGYTMWYYTAPGSAFEEVTLGLPE